MWIIFVSLLGMFGLGFLIVYVVDVWTFLRSTDRRGKPLTKHLKDGFKAAWPSIDFEGDDVLIAKDASGWEKAARSLFVLSGLTALISIRFLISNRPSSYVVEFLGRSVRLDAALLVGFAFITGIFGGLFLLLDRLGQPEEERSRPHPWSP